jgi:hypothetical protein
MSFWLLFFWSKINWSSQEGSMIRKKSIWVLLNIFISHLKVRIYLFNWRKKSNLFGWKFLKTFILLVFMLLTWSYTCSYWLWVWYNSIYKLFKCLDGASTNTHTHTHPHTHTHTHTHTHFDWCKRMWKSFNEQFL